MGTPVEFLAMEDIDKVLHYLLADGQMTRAFDDVDDMTQLLEEKLELAAKIGKTLLDKNKELERQLIDAGSKLNSAEDRVKQLEHSLSAKNNLLKMLFNNGPNEADDEEELIGDGVPNADDHAASKADYLACAGKSESHRTAGSLGVGPEGSSLSQTSVSLPQLHSALRRMQEEIVALHSERDRCAGGSCTEQQQLEKRENALGQECARQLIATNAHIHRLIEELTKKSDTCINQQSELAKLLTQRQDWENRAYHLATENAMLVSRLEDSQIAQRGLTEELRSLYDKHDECLALFNSTREKIRLLRKRSRRQPFRTTPSFTQITNVNASDESSTPEAHARCIPLSRSGVESLATASNHQGKTGPKASTTTSDLEETVSSSGFVSGSDLAERLPVATSSSARLPSPRRAGSAFTTPQFMSSKSIAGAMDPTENDSNPSSLAEELYLAEMEIGQASRQEEEEAHKRHSWFGCYGDDEEHGWQERAHRDWEDSLSRRSAHSPSPCSEGLSFFRESTPSPLTSVNQRLQLVKPFDGSQILRQWQKLATPSLTRALFEAPTPCVQSRAGRCLEAIPSPLPASSSTTSQLPSSTAVDSLLSSWSPASVTDDRQRLQYVPFDLVPLRPHNQTQPAVVSRPSSVGLDFSAQLLNNSLRAHSVERIPTLVPAAAPPLGRYRHSSVVERNTFTAKTSQETSLFSLASLVSALSPISSATTSGRLSPKGTGGGLSRQHFLHTRGLVDVPGFDTDLSDPPTTSPEVFDKNTIHRVTRSRLQSEVTSAPRLPSAMPPPWPIQQPASTTAIRSRTSTTASAVGLTGILEEEAGSPPRTDVLGPTE